VCCQAELEALNSAADSINKLENELQVCVCCSIPTADIANYLFDSVDFAYVQFLCAFLLDVSE